MPANWISNSISQWIPKVGIVDSGLILIISGCLIAILIILKLNLYSVRLSGGFLYNNIRQDRRKHPNLLYEFAKIEPHFIIYWNENNTPILLGEKNNIQEIVGCIDPLIFSDWLPQDRRKIIESSVSLLKTNGTPFQLILQASNGNQVQIDGKIVNNFATLRIKNIDAQQKNYSDLNNEFENLKIETVGLRAILDTLSQPIWLRDRNGRLSWVNEQYAFAVDTEQTHEVIAKQIEFLDLSLQKDIIKTLQKGDMFQNRVPVIVSGQRRILDIIETPLAAGSIGYAIDVSELEATRHDLQTQMASHVLTLDQLPTAVAIFDEKQRLVFCNLAYRTLWQLDEKFTQSNPTDSEVLDQLRDARRLPEQADYKSWKKSLQEAYQSLETHEVAWYLPGGKTLRVVVNPNPQGGVTYLFEDVTAQFNLQSNYNALSRVQSETLDSLKEGVAVFGTDGKLKLNNPAFETMWELKENDLSQQPHIDEIILEANKIYDDPQVWSDIKGAIGGFNDTRKGHSYRMERSNGSIVDCNLAPLPDGATLVTFIDVSASVNVERALKDRNDALEQAARLRENFVHHVSYQLRSPLTNVIGFTELLASGAAGHLTQKQSEYIDHVFQSSNSLMAIIDDILDLASFDRGEIILERKNTKVNDIISASIEGLKDRIDERNLSLNVEISSDIDDFFLDGKRVQQILFNLISNSIAFSSEGQSISVRASLEASTLNISVIDNGRGIPKELISKVFDRFETYTIGSRHRGPGLGLSIVRALVELHGGNVKINSQAGQGTIISCLFPAKTFESMMIESK